MLSNRTGWRDEQYPNREVTRLLCHVTVSGTYPDGGESLPVWGADGVVSAINVSPPVVDGVHIVWNNKPTDVRLLFLGPDLQPMEAGTDLPNCDITVEAVLENG